MATNALEEKINKIRQQNEEIKRRHEEVEEDKKNAAKLNALVQMVPSTDWPERKEPPEFFNLPRANCKLKSAKEHHEHSQQYSVGEGRKIYTFAQGQGPPPDPKYNFLADSEREEDNIEGIKDNSLNRGQKHARGMFKKKPGGKDGIQRDYRTRTVHRDEHQPEYEAWRAERNRIDEDRISRQRTAEGNWRREWDNDKAHIMDEVTRSETKFGDYMRKDHKDIDRRYSINGNDYAHHSRGGNHRFYRNQRHFHSNYENRSNMYHQDGHVKNSLSPGSEERTVIATDKSIKVTLNQGNTTKGPVMSVKVNSPSIAGTGRVGPRQRSRITYSSHSDVEAVSVETESSIRPKSFEDKNKGIYHDNIQRSTNMRKSQSLSKKKDLCNKSPPYFRKENKKENVSENPKYDTELKPSNMRKEYKESYKSYQSDKSRKLDNAKPLQYDDPVMHTNTEENNVTISSESDVKNIELVESKANQNDDLYTQVNVNEIYTKIQSELILANSDLSAPKVETDIDTCTTVIKSHETQIIQATVLPKYEIIKTNLTTSSVKVTDDNNDRSEVEHTVNSCDTNDDNEKIKDDKKQNLLTKQPMEIVSYNCDQNQNINKQEDSVKYNVKDYHEKKEIIPPAIDAFSVIEENIPESDDEVLKTKRTLITKDGIAVINYKTDNINKQDVMICVNEIQGRTCDNNNEEKINTISGVIIGKLESLKEDLKVEEKKTNTNEEMETGK